MGKAEQAEHLRKTADIKSKKIHCGSMITLRHDDISLSNGHLIKYDVVEHPGAVVIIPIHPDGIVLIRQYRYPIDQIIYELPAGCLDTGENPSHAANRELREETTFSAHKLLDVGSYYMAPGYTNELLTFFIATDLEVNPLTAEDTEEIDVVIVSLQEALSMIQNRTIIDAKTVMGVFLYQKWAHEKPF